MNLGPLPSKEDEFPSQLLRLGERRNLSQRDAAQPWPKINLAHFSLTDHGWWNDSIESNGRTCVFNRDLIFSEMTKTQWRNQGEGAQETSPLPLFSHPEKTKTYIQTAVDLLIWSVYCQENN